MASYNPALTPFLSRVKLEAQRSSPLVDGTLYHQRVGIITYLTHIRPHISYVLGMVSQFMQEPYKLHWKVAKWILHYIEGSHSYEIHYVVGIQLDLVGYTDTDWVGDSQDCKYTLGYDFSLGSGPVCCSRKKQSAIALSFTKVEYQEVVNAGTKAIWLQHLLTKFGIQIKCPSDICCDNLSAIQISQNAVHHKWTKHIKIHMHYIQELIHGHFIDLHYCLTFEQVVDIFTKPFTESKFLYLLALLGVQDASSFEGASYSHSKS